jgi:LmbE family N-acetylglucosaminyl deacetylase
MSSKISLFAVLCCVILPFLSIGQGTASDKSIMAIFAHPDDEMTIAPLLVRYAEEGAVVTLVICTDGRLGTNDFTDHEAGDGLVAMRNEEMKCAAEKLGVDLVHLDYHDQLRAGEGYDGHVPHARKLVLELNELVEKYSPDVLITWGPDGGTTHMDHRLVGASVTQVFVSKKWDKPSSLFYYGTPSGKLDDAEQKTLRGVDESLLNVRVSYTPAHAEKALESLKCHETQVSPEMFASRKESYEKGDYTIYLREFKAPEDMRTSLFGPY